MRKRTFAAPFVLTIACSAPPTKVHTHDNPPEPRPKEPTEPTTDPTTGSGSGSAETPKEPDPVRISWRVSKQGTKCQAFQNVQCPEPAPGEPRMSCNPPRPVDYDCKAMTPPFTIEQRGELCTVYHDDNCPPTARCNPPPPQKVDCPHY